MPNRCMLVPRDHLCLILIESWFDEITTCQWPSDSDFIVHDFIVQGGPISPGQITTDGLDVSQKESLLKWPHIWKYV